MGHNACLHQTMDHDLKLGKKYSRHQHGSHYRNTRENKLSFHGDLTTVHMVTIVNKPISYFTSLDPPV